MNIDISDRLNDAIPVFAVLIVGFAFVLLTIVFRSFACAACCCCRFHVDDDSHSWDLCISLARRESHRLFKIPERGPILAFLPILSIGILFGLAMDYQVFLVSRMREEYVKQRIQYKPFRLD